MSQIASLSAFTYGGVLYSKEGGDLTIADIKIDSNTGRIIYTANGDSRDITDTLTSDEQAVLYQTAPSYQFSSFIPEAKSTIQPYEWILMGGGVLVMMLLIMRKR